MSHYTTFYLEMNSPGELNAHALPAALKIIECEEAQFQFNRLLYQLVGSDWGWEEPRAVGPD